MVSKSEKKGKWASRTRLSGLFTGPYLTSLAYEKMPDLIIRLYGEFVNSQRPTEYIMNFYPLAGAVTLGVALAGLGVVATGIGAAQAYRYVKRSVIPESR